MRKLSILFISALLLLGFALEARAELGAHSYTGKRYEEQQVFIFAYNNSGSDVTSYSVVILDTSGTAGTTLGTYFTTTTSTDSVYVLGVVAEDSITAGEVGKICVRGPHKVLMASGDTAAGDTIGTYTPTGTCETTTATTNKSGQLGFALKGSSDSSAIWWCWIRPTNQ